jgi:uncharacterized membrane protein
MNECENVDQRHGVLNVVGWGILLPCGVLAARYLRFTDPTWFYAHVFFQISGFLIGVAGWATGLRLGSYSVGLVYHKHRTIAIVLFSISTLQVNRQSVLSRGIWWGCRESGGGGFK